MKQTRIWPLNCFSTFKLLAGWLTFFSSRQRTCYSDPNLDNPSQTKPKIMTILNAQFLLILSFFLACASLLKHTKCVTRFQKSNIYSIYSDQLQHLHIRLKFWIFAPTKLVKNLFFERTIQIWKTVSIYFVRRNCIMMRKHSLAADGKSTQFQVWSS